MHASPKPHRTQEITALQSFSHKTVHMDVTPLFQEIVLRRRTLLGHAAPAHMLMRSPRVMSAFGADAHKTLQKIHSTVQFLCDGANLLDGLHGDMPEIACDEVIDETQRFLRVCGDRIERLKQHTAQENKAKSCSNVSPQLQLVAHRHSTIQLLQAQLKEASWLFDRYRGRRLRHAAEVHEQRLGAAAEVAGRFGQHGALTAPSSSCSREVSGTGAGLSVMGAAVSAGLDNLSLGWEDTELLEDEALDGAEQAQLQMENDVLQKELETTVEQAREAESRMLEISHLSHSFANVDQQSSEVEALFKQAEQTSENLVRGNAYLDSATKQSRDFRLLVLSFFLFSSFGLLFLDWYYD